MNKQQFYNQVCQSLRSYGNPYGSTEARGWGWMNDNNPNERCAIARFIGGCTESQVVRNLRKELGLEKGEEYPQIVLDIVHFFDYAPLSCNRKDSLEQELKSLADKHKLEYKEPVNLKRTEIKVESIKLNREQVVES
jgi:hypothetical protein